MFNISVDANETALRSVVATVYFFRLFPQFSTVDRHMDMIVIIVETTVNRFSSTERVELTCAQVVLLPALFSAPSPPISFFFSLDSITLCFISLPPCLSGSPFIMAPYLTCHLTLVLCFQPQYIFIPFVFLHSPFFLSRHPSILVC